MNKIIINLATEYTDTPGGRHISDGEYSGEHFRDTVLLPKYREAIASKMKLEVNLDGCFGYPSSFLDESFGGLAKIFKERNVLEDIIIISNDQPSLIKDIEKSIREAQAEE